MRFGTTCPAIRRSCSKNPLPRRALADETQRLLENRPRHRGTAGGRIGEHIQGEIHTDRESVDQGF